MGYVYRAASADNVIAARIDCPQDVYELLNLAHSDSVDEIGEDHPVTNALAEAMNAVSEYLSCEYLAEVPDDA
jgi:hypothetical protein